MTGGAVTVVGAGLAGCEAAWQAARLGTAVRLIDMKPGARTPAHCYDGFAELVCSNSFGSQSVENAKGLLKQELRLLGSIAVSCADRFRVPAGGALAVDRVRFSDAVTEAIGSCANIRVECAELDKIPNERPCIIATGPLTTQKLLDDIDGLLGGGRLYFFDAASPIVAANSIDMSRTYRMSRYDKGEGGYINCPMTREQYESFTGELCGAEVAEQRGFEDSKLFEGCMPVESMAKRGRDTLRFGPLKPRGLKNPATGAEPYAVVQLRQDDLEGGLYNLVGFQTRLKFGEQKRVFSMIPGLERAEFVRYGVMHRNAYINSQHTLTRHYEAREHPGLYFAGQLSGVEGYMESVSSGLTAGIFAALREREKYGNPRGLPNGYQGIYPEVYLPGLPPESMTGALAAYISANRDGGAGAIDITDGIGGTGYNQAGANGRNDMYQGCYKLPQNGIINANEFSLVKIARFQPMNANFGILPPLDEAGMKKPKRERNRLYVKRSLESLGAFAGAID